MSRWERRVAFVAGAVMVVVAVYELLFVFRVHEALFS